LGLVLGGIFGNLTDRIFRSPGGLQGEVVDWIQIPNWPVFNIADSAVVCGAILITVLNWKNIEFSKSEDKK
jgi:signal peptidase II